jgi:hypothetical protein
MVLALLRISTVLALMFALGSTGCGKKKQPPAIVEVQGVVLLNGAPLPFADVTFMPQLEHFGAEYNSTAVTDAEGRFVLKCAKDGKNGAAVGKHKVLILEHTPDEHRGMGREAQEGLAKYHAGLKNRPIPEAYGQLLNTPLEIEVKADQKEYTLQLSR